MSGTESFSKVLGIEEGIKCLPGVSFEQYRNLLFFSEVDNNKNNDFRSPNEFIARITNNNSDFLNDKIKNEERENSVAKQRRKLEKELNLHNSLNEYKICNKKEDVNKENDENTVDDFLIKINIYV